MCLAATSAGCLGAASKRFRAGRKAEKSGDVARAYLLYSQAAALDPENRKYWQRSQAVRTRAALQLKLKPPAAPLPPGELTEEEFQTITETDLAEARAPRPPIRLIPGPVRKDLDLRGDAKALWEEVARAFGLDTVFDGDYQPGQPIRFRMEDANHREALHALELATASFAVPLSDRLLLVAKETPQKRADLDPFVTVVIPLPEPVSVQEAQELAQAVRQSLTLNKFHVDSIRRMAVIRDQVSKVRIAQLVFRQLLQHRPEVAIDLEFREVARVNSLSYGLKLPASFPLDFLGTVLGSVKPSITGPLFVFGGGRTIFGLGVASTQLIARMSRSNASSLLQTTLRSVDGQPATFHVGDRFPILTGGFFGPPPTGDEEVFIPPPTVNFEDLGALIKITPHVHDMEEATLEVEAEFKVLGGESFNGIPVISTRKLSSHVRLRFDEWAVIAGLMNEAEARSITGLAGLSHVPFLGALVRRHDRDRGVSEVLILIKPRLLSLPPSQRVTHALRTGTDTRPITPL
ncbi:MAG: type II and III secretion system protein [Bryobacteraceae bacterium]